MMNVCAFISGTPHDFSQPAFDAAVAARAALVLPTLTERTGSVVYDGNRCRPENLGWRLRQGHGMTSLEAVAAGEIDAQIEETWHLAAECEHWYRYEKDWGW